MFLFLFTLSLSDTINIGDQKFGSLLIHSNDQILTNFEDGHELFLMFSENMQKHIKFTIAKNDSRTYTPNMIDNAYAFSFIENTSIEFINYNNSVYLQYWVIPSTICPTHALFFMAGKEIKYKFDAKDDSFLLCLFSPLSNLHKVELEFGFTSVEGTAISSLYTSRSTSTPTRTCRKRKCEADVTSSFFIAYNKSGSGGSLYFERENDDDDEEIRDEYYSKCEHSFFAHVGYDDGVSVQALEGEEAKYKCKQAKSDKDKKVDEYEPIIFIGLSVIILVAVVVFSVIILRKCMSRRKNYSMKIDNEDEDDDEYQQVLINL